MGRRKGGKNRSPYKTKSEALLRKLDKKYKGRGWYKQSIRHAVAAKKGWVNRKSSKANRTPRKNKYYFYNWNGERCQTDYPMYRRLKKRGVEVEKIPTPRLQEMMKKRSTANRPKNPLVRIEDGAHDSALDGERNFNEVYEDATGDIDATIGLEEWQEKHGITDSELRKAVHRGLESGKRERVLEEHESGV